MNIKLRVLVVDDTVLYRKIMTDIVLSLPDCEMTGSAQNGEVALQKIEQDPPDLVLLDVEMPVMDGLTTLRTIRRTKPDIGVIMVSGITERQAAITMEALSAGAVDFVPKPQGTNFQDNFTELRANLTPIVQMFANKRKTLAIIQATKNLQSTFQTGLTKPVRVPEASPVAPAPKKEVFAPLPKRFDILAIGVSTGGPNSLAVFIPSLPRDLGVPVLIVQHMPPMFTKSLAGHLGQKSQMPVIEAEDGMILERNKVYIAPGGKHMIIRKHQATNAPQIAITDTPPVNSCKPSVDVMFESLPKYYVGTILAVVMTGMGNDGAAGVRTMKKTGCYCLTQSEETCVVYGMPRAVVEAGVSDEALSLERLGSRVVELVMWGRL